MKAILIIGFIFFTYSMFMIWLLAKYSYKKSKPIRNKIIDHLEANWNLYIIKRDIQLRKIAESREIEVVEVEEVREIDRPRQWEWNVTTDKRLGERFANTELIE